MSRYERLKAELARLVAEHAPVDRLKAVNRAIEQEERWRDEFWAIIGVSA